MCLSMAFLRPNGARAACHTLVFFLGSVDIQECWFVIFFCCFFVVAAYYILCTCVFACCLCGVRVLPVFFSGLRWAWCVFAVCALTQVTGDTSTSGTNVADVSGGPGRDQHYLLYLAQPTQLLLTTCPGAWGDAATNNTGATAINATV